MSKYRHWTFTLNNYTKDDIAKLQQLSDTVKYLIYGKEVGASGTPHLQGFMSFAGPRRVSAIRSLFDSRAHIEVARDPRAAAQYCRKEGDFVEFGDNPDESRKRQGRRTDIQALVSAISEGETDRKRLRQEHPEVCAKYPNFVTQCILDQLPVPDVPTYELRRWQRELTVYLKQPSNDREIVFVVDRQGNSGKSWYTKYHSMVYDNSICILPGKKADMVYALISLITPAIKTVFIDAPRSKQGEYIQYDFLEELKNGIVFNTKYEFRMVSFQVPHVVVMMNHEPDGDKLSGDRYKIIRTK